jgi:hypothetical protein
VSHDSLCPRVLMGDGFCMWCEVIAEVRADERERAEAEVAATAKWCREDERLTLSAQVEELRGRPIAMFDGYLGRDALDQVLNLIDGGTDALNTRTAPCST